MKMIPPFSVSLSGLRTSAGKPVVCRPASTAVDSSVHMHAPTQMNPHRTLRLLSALSAMSIALVGCADSSNGIPLATDNTPRDTAMVSEVVACATCSLRIADSVVLGTPTDSLVPIRNVEFARDSRGNTRLFTDGTSFPILCYDSVGHFRGQLGKQGSGPGEYRQVSKVAVGAGDSVFVIEPAGMVIHVFAPNSEFVRRITLQNAGWVSEVGRGGPAVYYGKAITDGGTSPQTKLVRLRADTRVLDSIALYAPPSGYQITVETVLDDGNKQDPLKMELPLESNVFPARDGSFWIVSDGNYRLEQYDSTGTPRKLFWSSHCRRAVAGHDSLRGKKSSFQRSKD